MGNEESEHSGWGQRMWNDENGPDDICSEANAACCDEWTRPRMWDFDMSAGEWDEPVSGSQASTGEMVD